MPGKRDQAQSGGAAARRSGADLTPFRAIAESVSASGGELVDQVSALIEQAQAFAATQVDATLTLRNWYIGRMIDVAVLREGRAGHDQELVASLAQQLTSRYGRGYDRTNLYRMVRFSQQFTEPELVASLAQQVSWTHFRELLPLATDDARAFYVREIIDRHLSVRDLRYAISRKAFERREIADSQIPQGSAVPLDAFRDPMLLDMLGLADTYLERDLEAALRHDMEAFLLEVGRGWAFVERQKRMTFDGDDYYLTLSSFTAHPGLPVWHSRDLINWQPIGHAITKNVGSISTSSTSRTLTPSFKSLSRPHRASPSTRSMAGAPGVGDRGASRSSGCPPEPVPTQS